MTQIADKTITHKTMTQTQNHCVGILEILYLNILFMIKYRGIKDKKQMDAVSVMVDYGNPFVPFNMVTQQTLASNWT